MLRLTPEQMQVLDAYAFASFVTRMQAHARHFFPKVCAALSDEELASLVGRGIAQARACDIRDKQDVCRYLNLVLLLGGDFAADERYAWVRRILHDPYVRSGPARLALLEAATERRLAEQAGKV